MPAPKISKGDRREICNALLTSLPITKIAEIFNLPTTNVTTIAIRFYRSHGCINRVDYMAAEIKRLREKYEPAAN